MVHLYLNPSPLTLKASPPYDFRSMAGVKFLVRTCIMLSDITSALVRQCTTGRLRRKQAMPNCVHDLISSWHNKSTQECTLGMMQQMPCSCMHVLLGSSGSCKMHCTMHMHRTQTAANTIATRSCTITHKNMGRVHWFNVVRSSSSPSQNVYFSSETSSLHWKSK